jgi:probable HAF family extracellular repeat protein
MKTNIRMSSYILRTVGLTTLVLVVGLAAAVFATDYNYTTIDFPGAIDSAAGGINKSGQIVGGYELPDGSRHGFLYSGGVFTTIDDPNRAPGSGPGTGSENHGINTSGQIVGPYNLNSIEGNHAFEGVHGFLDSGGMFTSIDFPSSPGNQVSNTTPQKINDSGVIVGVYRIMGGPGSGFLFSGGTYTTVNVPTSLGCCTHANGINNANEIVGQYKDCDSCAHHGFLDNGGAFTSINVPGATDTIATDINNFGDIVGGYKPTTGGELGFLDTGGSFTTIAFPNAIATLAAGINDDGDIVGLYEDQNKAFHGFLATPVTVSCPFGGGGPECANPLVGSASDCTVFETNGSTVSITGPSAVNGSVCVGSNGALSMSGSAKVSEMVELATGARFSASGSATTGGVNKNVDLSSRVAAAQNASSSAAAMCSTYSGSVSTTQTITGTGSAKTLCLQNVNLSGGNVLTLTGPSGTAFIINVAGTFTLTGGSKIIVAGAVQPKDVLINVVGTGQDAALTGSSSVQGTLLAPNRKINVSASFVTGQVVSGQNIAITSGGQVNCSCTPSGE